ncbi:HlyD family secretion protein [Luteibacter rhizovicinus]|uniref:HlyD family secretion protein n=2 Tax=Luteibacter rhizovicinus TaxID=242606 RepID=A0A4R3YJT7_9GAMM|nr:HlyD family secretion protein [Luteibacter rhizovicinus]
MGTVRMRPPALGWYLFAIALLLPAALAVLLFTGTYTNHAHATGKLVASGGVIAITAPTHGVVSRIRFPSGAHVQKNDALVDISAEHASAAFGDTFAALARSHRERIDVLRKQKTELTIESQRQREGIEKRLALLLAELAEVREETALTRQRAQLAEGLHSRWSALSRRGLVSDVDLLRQKDVALEHAARSKQLRQHELELAGEAKALNAALDETRASERTRGTELDQKIAATTQELAQAELHRDETLRSPVDGTVVDIVARTGQRVATGERLATVLPEGTRLAAEVWLPTRAADAVRTGQSALIRYESTLTHARIAMHGRVVDVAALPSTQPDVSGYRTLIDFETGDAKIKLGMAVTADIAVSRVRLADALFGARP